MCAVDSGPDVVHEPISCEAIPHRQKSRREIGAIAAMEAWLRFVRAAAL